MSWSDDVGAVARSVRSLQGFGLGVAAEAVTIERHGLHQREDGLSRRQLQLLKCAQSDARQEHHRLLRRADIELQIDLWSAPGRHFDQLAGKSIADREMLRPFGCEH